MKPAPFEYHSPASVAEALILLAELEDAKVLAGGQSLIPLLNFRLARPAHLVDINEIVELGRIVERDGGIAIGANVRQADAQADPLVRNRCPLLPVALGLVAHPVIRNRGTVCGSLAHADPAAELCATLLALDGRVRARSLRGERVISASDLFLGPMESALAADELLTEAWFPNFVGPGAISEEVRRHGDFAIAGAVRAGDRLAVFGVATRPQLADPADPTRGLSPSAQPECSPEFRLHLLEAVVERVMKA
ncbi:MAG TPA: FAD binding domain-containing protein [Candidatus Dormibacteraeota bacterium]|nr:FAD binding domain-containing protein [Candidatus Dormibacteraeota bacterium]